MSESLQTYKPKDAADWRRWLAAHHQTEKRIWLVYNRRPLPENISYEDTVREALCFGWIDSTARTLSETERAQQFTPRNPKSSWSQPNRERARQLKAAGKMTEAGLKLLPADLDEPYAIPDYIIQALQRDPVVWANFQSFPENYQRIRAAYVDDANKLPDIQQKRLENLIRKTRAGKRFGLWDFTR